MNIFEFMDARPAITIILSILVFIVFILIVQLPNIILRHLNIRKYGYPPPHCDVDGKFEDHDS